MNLLWHQTKGILREEKEWNISYYEKLPCEVSICSFFQLNVRKSTLIQS